MYIGIYKCRFSQIYSKTLYVIVANSAIIEISEKKMHNFFIFAYSFQNFYQLHSKYALSIVIYVRQQQNAFD